MVCEIGAFKTQGGPPRLAKFYGYSLLHRSSFICGTPEANCIIRTVAAKRS